MLTLWIAEFVEPIDQRESDGSAVRRDSHGIAFSPLTDAHRALGTLGHEQRHLERRPRRLRMGACQRRVAVRDRRVLSITAPFSDLPIEERSQAAGVHLTRLRISSPTT